MAGSALRWKIKPLLVLAAMSAILFVATIKLFQHTTVLRAHINEAFVEDESNNMLDGNNLREKPVEELINWDEPSGQVNPNNPGEGGHPVNIGPDEKGKAEKSYAEYGFNQYVSDKISLHRSLEDVRPTECLLKKYQAVLPKVSVIIIFHNEGWSTLLRTVHSVLNRSPPELLHEIVLCDDASTKDHLKKPLDDYVAGIPKLKLVRTTQREGLIRARVYGADHSTGEILLFLDSHCEANVGWLPPLLSEIKKDYRTVVCPTVDFIDHNDFHYRGVDPYIRGTFDWKFDYKERGITQKMRDARKDTTEGVKSPVMAGGLFAISRKFWEQLGKYDPGMYVWGGEQYEISFKLWMCGGQMMNMPCSRVGHVYRRNVPYSYDKPHAVLVNFKRVAEVWMDEFREFLYHKRPDIKSQKTGPIYERVELRESLKCKSFKWYLKNVANDTIRTRYEPDRGVGKIQHVKSQLCFQLGYQVPSTVTLMNCDGNFAQEFRWTYMYELRHGEEHCLDARYTDLYNVYREKCHLMGGNQKFVYKQESKQIHHAGSGKCLSVSSNENPPTRPMLEVCNESSENQKWFIKLQDITQAVPDWALIAEDLPHHPIP